MKRKLGEMFTAKAALKLVDAVGIYVILAALGLSWWGLYTFGRHYGVPTFFAALISSVFDGTALAMGGQALKQVEARASGAAPTFCVWTFASLSAYLNTQHVLFSHEPWMLIPFWASAPAAAVLLFHFKTRWARRKALINGGFQYSAPMPQFGAEAYIWFSLSTLRARLEAVLRRRNAVRDHDRKRVSALPEPRAATRPVTPSAAATVTATGTATAESATPSATVAGATANATESRATEPSVTEASATEARSVDPSATEPSATVADPSPLSLVSARCEECGTPFTPTRAGQRYCPGTSRCRTAATRRRQREALRSSDGSATGEALPDKRYGDHSS